jgi:glyoxylase-like metal-dependent hydrolase (beta-lactamase superfamily II)
MYGQPVLDVPIWVPESDSAEVAATLQIAGTFAQREMIGEDLEVIPTPGHTAGTTTYLWSSGVHRFLFTGDFIWIEKGEWKAVVLDQSLRTDYLNSLELVRELNFDVLVPWGTTEGDPSVGLLSGELDKRRRIDAIIDRVRRGENS